jgi:hypothetical protein
MPITWSIDLIGIRAKTDSRARESVFFSAVQLDLDYAAELTHHEFGTFCQPDRSSLARRSPATDWDGFIATMTSASRAHGVGSDRPGLFRNQPIWHIVQQLDLADGATPSASVPSTALARRKRHGEAPRSHYAKLQRYATLMNTQLTSSNRK